MRNFSRLSVFCAVFAAAALLGSSVCRAEDMDNPEYKSWSKSKPGTVVKMKTSTSASGTDMESETMTTLKEITPDHATVEEANSMTVMGKMQEMPAQPRTIPAKLPKMTGPNPAGDKPAGMEIKESTEDVTIAGQTYHCKCVETKGDSNGMKVNSKILTCEDMPGYRVKMDTKTEGTNMSMTSKSEVTEVKQGK